MTVPVVTGAALTVTVQVVLKLSLVSVTVFVPAVLYVGTNVAPVPDAGVAPVAVHAYVPSPPAASRESLTG